MQDRIIKLCRAHDPALSALSAEQVLAYARSRADGEASLPQLPASATAPTWFHTRRLRQSQVFDYVERATSDPEKWRRAFAAGVVRVEGPLCTKTFGADAWEPAEIHRDGYQHMELDELDGFAPLDIIDIGQWIYTLSYAPKDSAPRLGVQPMSLAVLAGFAFQSAAPSPSSARPSKPKRKGR